MRMIFGRSSSINAAVIRAHREGILTTASLMVNGRAADEAVELAHQNPRLGVGLHLTLVCGRSALKPTEIPSLVDNRYEFSYRPVWTGFKYFIHPGIRVQLRHEMTAQFDKFKLTRLRLDHVNGHLNSSSASHHFQRSCGITRALLGRQPREGDHG